MEIAMSYYMDDLERISSWNKGICLVGAWVEERRIALTVKNALGCK